MCSFEEALNHYTKYFNQLPCSIRIRAIRNFKKQKHYNKSLNSVNNTYKALTNGFSFASTSEKWDYWMYVSNEYYKPDKYKSYEYKYIMEYERNNPISNYPIIEFLKTF